jgi:hypothetical protein
LKNWEHKTILSLVPRGIIITLVSPECIALHFPLQNIK